MLNALLEKRPEIFDNTPEQFSTITDKVYFILIPLLKLMVYQTIVLVWLENFSQTITVADTVLQSLVILISQRLLRLMV